MTKHSIKSMKNVEYANICLTDYEKLNDFFQKSSTQQYLRAIDLAHENYRQGIKSFKVSDKKDKTYNKYRKISNLTLELAGSLLFAKGVSISDESEPPTPKLDKKESNM